MGVMAVIGVLAQVVLAAEEREEVSPQFKEMAVTKPTFEV